MRAGPSLFHSPPVTVPPPDIVYTPTLFISFIHIFAALLVVIIVICFWTPCYCIKLARTRWYCVFLLLFQTAGKWGYRRTIISSWKLFFTAYPSTNTCSRIHEADIAKRAKRATKNGSWEVPKLCCSQVSRCSGVNRKRDNLVMTTSHVCTCGASAPPQRPLLCFVRAGKWGEVKSKRTLKESLRRTECGDACASSSKLSKRLFWRAVRFTKRGCHPLLVLHVIENKLRSHWMWSMATTNFPVRFFPSRSTSCQEIKKISPRA